MNRRGKKILIGNSFPLGLVRRSVRIDPVRVADLRNAVRGAEVLTYWGHPDTLERLQRMLRRKVRPPSDRPALRVSRDGLPQFGGQSFREVWVVTPRPRPGHRPPPGAATSAVPVRWQVLRLRWLPAQGVRNATTRGPGRGGKQ